jgi:PAS domain S-box-containing protein
MNEVDIPSEAGGPSLGGRLFEMNEALFRLAASPRDASVASASGAEALRDSKAELRDQLAETELLRSLSAEMIQGKIEALYEKIVDIAVAITRSDCASMQMLHPERGAHGELRLLAHRGFTPEAASAWAWVAAEECTVCGLALARGTRVVVPDVEDCELLVGKDALRSYRQTGICSVQSTPLVSRSGTLIGMLSTHWRRAHEPSLHQLHTLDLLARQAADLIDRNQAEEALRASAEEARRLLDLVRNTTASMAEGLYTIDVHGRATFVNPEAERLLGWGPGELLGRVMHDVMHHKHADGSAFPEHACPKLRALRTGEALTDYEDEFVKRDGSSFPVSFSSSPLRGVDGAIVGLVIVFQDVSERKRARQELQNAAETLADMNRRKDEFLAMLSHELRNPLAPISAALHLLRMHRSESESSIERQAYAVIERQVGNLTKIVNDLLEVSRVVSGRIRLDTQVVDLNRVVAHALETSRYMLEQRRHELRFHACSDAAWVAGDVTRLEEVLVNLLNNAAKYTPDGGHIEVHCEPCQEAGYAQLRVRDDGIGIDEDLLRDGKIFDLFTQADRSLARSAGGLGIGLSLVHRLVNLHGGTISVSSPPAGASKGSEFRVRFPLVPAPEPSAPEGLPASLPNPEGVRILVVDDNSDLVSVLGSTLRQAGYSVQSAHSGTEGLRLAQQWRPDIVLLDIGLPELDGYEVARRLRADPALGQHGSSMRIIALTGYGREADLALAREAGFDMHLTKPIAFADLEKLLAAPSLRSASPRERS